MIIGPWWKDIYNCFFVDRYGIVIDSTIEKSKLLNKKIKGMDIKTLLPPVKVIEYINKLHKALASGITQIVEYKIATENFIALIEKIDDDIAVVHEAHILPGCNVLKIKKMLVASSGHLFNKYYTQRTG